MTNIPPTESSLNNSKNILTIPSEPLSPAQFTEILLRKNIPTTYERCFNAATEMLEANAPEFFLNNLARNLNVIGQDSFYRNLRKMAMIISQQSRTETYDFIYFSGSGSSQWMYNQLVKLGVKPAVRVISTESHKNLPEHSIKKTDNLFILEDWIISGGHIDNFIWDKIFLASGKTRATMPKISAYALYSTAYAKRSLTRLGINTQIVEDTKIPLLEEVLSFAEINFLTKIGADLPNGKGEILSETHTLTSGWWCVPDNIPLILTSPQSKFSFIDQTAITKPY